MGKNPELIFGKRAGWIYRRLHFNILKVLFQIHLQPVKALKSLKQLIEFRKKQQGLERIFKFVKFNERYFWSSELPGFPSSQLKHFLKNEIARQQPCHKKIGDAANLHTIIWGITNRCPLNCSHCYDWDNIEAKDRLSLGELIEILKIFEDHGVRHLQFSGGEPLTRFNDLVALIKKASELMDCWLLTSGFGLSAEKARYLKEAGLLGVNISLDHWRAEKHNAFRRNDKSFDWVKSAVENCREAGLMISFSLCATREFVTTENLMAYATLAKESGVHFIRVLEPRAVGNFAGEDVELTAKSIATLSEFFHQLNSNPVFRQFPIVNFFGYFQREIGCMGAGNRYVYVDAKGEVHACPFCRGSKGNILEKPFPEIVADLRETGCHFFRNEITYK